ncbi:MAG: hypothetical protein HQ582_25965 [Planctomycetes bacterium]|nr:hypothetical protein [Planctomycetota bacterium]
MPETSPDGPQPPPPNPRRRFQFGLATMLLAVLPISVLAAAWAGMMGLGAGNSPFPQGLYVLMAAAAPMGVMILVSVCRAVLKWLGQAVQNRQDD